MQGDKEFSYTGVAKCKMCHSKDKTGNQYAIWQKDKHSKAYETLASEESKKIAKEKGIADAQKAPECLKCHVTAYGVDAKLLDKKFKIEDGVGCESCHGPGSGYYSNKVMKDIYAGKLDGATVGLIEPDEKLCVTCHNAESPTFKGFDYKKFSAQIAHPVKPLK
ncbi:MAG: cytochrome C554 [Calditrichaeota bacterium]|nr:MAG: cytochrome C554 [Calditrichota bacterium]